MPLSPGQILNNRYRIVKLLGQGGFGAVYRAWDTNFDEPVALKESIDISEPAQKQFKLEARLLFKLHHPNLPRVFDHFVVPGQGQYLVMDFVDGQDLGEMLKSGSLLEAKVLPWIIQVCDALSYLHSQNPPIIHRDIKPGNIKITPEGKAMLVDFGISKIYDPTLATTMGARAVTPGFSPQEQYGQGTTDARTDIYALGATLFTLLSGQQPPESIQRNLGVRLPLLREFNPSISISTEMAISKALETLPENRYQFVREFEAALITESYSEHREKIEKTKVVPSTTPIIQSWQVPVNTKPRTLPWRWLITVGVMGILVIILVAVLISQVQGGRNETPTGIDTTQEAALIPSDIITPIIPTIKVPSNSLPVDFIDEYGVPMNLIPAGEFQMGNESGYDPEKPVHTVYLDAFYMDIYEVTNAQYRQCVESKFCAKPSYSKSYTLDSYYDNSTYNDYPVIYVDWERSQSFCEWRGTRLPTEAEWEKAARGKLEGKLYPWGDQTPVFSVANFAFYKGDTVQVGSYPPNGFGLYDMAGNVWEWVMDWYSDHYYAISSLNNPTGPSSGEYRILRGGSWIRNDFFLRVACRFSRASVGNYDIGFRCARTP